MTDLGSQGRPLRVAVIGAGPAGFYAAQALLHRGDLVTTIDLFDRLPTPFGQVRYGVAPDHPNIKKVRQVYAKILADPRVKIGGRQDLLAEAEA